MIGLPWWAKALGLAGAGVALAVGARLYIGHLESAAYEQGVADERAKWERAEKERQLAFRERADTASAKAAERQAAREKVFAPIEREVIRYVQTPAAAVVCIDDAGRDLMRRAVEAANADIAATASPGGPAVPAAARRSGDGG